MSHKQVPPLAGPMYVTLGRAGQPALGYTWRIWESGTSFYLKSRIAGMKHLKLSVHGDDPRHPSGGGYKLAMDTEEAFNDDLRTGRIIGRRSGAWPIWFPGRRVNEYATLVARLRWTHEATSRLGAAPDPGSLKSNAKGLAVPPPSAPGFASDVDLIVSEGRPYWKEEPKARRDNACLGPLQNPPTDLWLTGTVVQRFIPHYQHPVEALGPRPVDRDDQVRGVAAAVDPTGFLWLIEHRMSKSKTTPEA